MENIFIILTLVLLLLIGVLLFMVRSGKVRKIHGQTGKMAGSKTVSSTAEPDGHEDVDTGNSLEQKLDFILTPADGGAGRMDGPPLSVSKLVPPLAMAMDESIKSMDKFGESFERFKAFNNPNASLKDISDAVTKDIVFSSKVLEVANSPYFGMSGKVGSVHHAVTILGMDSMKTLYFKEYFKMLGKAGPKQAAVRKDIWNHSMAAAVIASCLADCTRGVSREVAFTLGLLHDVGKFVILGLPGKEQALDDPAAVFAGGVRSEVANVGAHHALAGRLAAESWNLPPVTARAIGLHHSLSLINEETRDKKRGFMAHLAVLYLADQLAKLLDGSTQDQSVSHPMPSGWDGFFNMDRVRELVLDGTLDQELAKSRAASG